MGLDGKPNELGRQLLATGNDKLYAGNEVGHLKTDKGVFPRNSRTHPEMIFENQDIAGDSFGYPLYGMIFADRDSTTKKLSLMGANKVGQCLMQLRKMLQEQEKQGISSPLLLK